MSDLRRRDSAASPWSLSACAIAVAAGVVLYLLRDDVVAAVTIWVNISTYNYCFLIPLISAYLLWQRRAEIARLTPSPTAWGLVVVAASAALWWAANAAVIAEIRQVAVVGILQGLLLGVLGREIYRRFLFPFLYLFLMVPSGTVLLPSLQSTTTGIASSLVALSGIPVFVEGFTIEAPHGVYLVAPGCAGLNFLLATIALALLYARLTYSGPIKRVICVISGLAISILANGIRVFGIIWIAEVSNRQIDIVDDHLLYGWGLFSLVMMAAMAIGLRFADPAPPAFSPAEAPRPSASSSVPRLAGIGVAMVLIVFAARGLAEPLWGPAAGGLADAPQGALALPAAFGGWQQAGNPSSAAERFPEADLATHRTYVKDGRQVDLLVIFQWRQREGHKVSAGEAALGLDGRQRARDTVSVDAAPEPFAVNVFHVGSAARQGHLVWSWYWIGGRQTTSALQARLLGILGHLSGDTRAAAVVMTTDETPDPAAAREALADFLAASRGLSPVLQQTRRSAR